MDKILIFKALSNETRNQILEWLKNPEQHFGVQYHLPTDTDFTNSICVGDIQEKAGLAQSVISSYLHTLRKSGLLESRRIGQWTYYRRNEEAIREFTMYLHNNL